MSLKTAAQSMIYFQVKDKRIDWGKKIVPSKQVFETTRENVIVTIVDTKKIKA